MELPNPCNKSAVLRTCARLGSVGFCDILLLETVSPSGTSPACGTEGSPSSYLLTIVVRFFAVESLV